MSPISLPFRQFRDYPPSPSHPATPSLSPPPELPLLLNLAKIDVVPAWKLSALLGAGAVAVGRQLVGFPALRQARAHRQRSTQHSFESVNVVFDKMKAFSSCMTKGVPFLLDLLSQRRRRLVSGQGVCTEQRRR